MRVIVHFLNATVGGSGMTRMELEDVPSWLARNPGYLIREIVPENLRAANELRAQSIKAKRAYAEALLVNLPEE